MPSVALLLSAPDPDARLATHLEAQQAPCYCPTCALRNLADGTQRQLFWLQQDRAARARS